MKKISSIKKIWTLALTVLFSLSIFGMLQSCGTDGVEVLPNPTPAEHTVQFKLTATNATVGNAVAMIGSATTEYSSLSGNTWESPELKVAHSEGSVAISAYGNGFGPTSVLKAEIFVDGKLVKYGTASGQDLNAIAFYSFK